MIEAKVKVIRIMPLPVVHPRWERDDSEYPETIQVSFGNGKIRTYVLKEDQPKPNLTTEDELTRLFKENTYGGYHTEGYKGKHAKKK